MTTERNSPGQDWQDIFTPQEAERLAKAALEATHDAPDDFIRALLPFIDDESVEVRVRDAIEMMVDGAFARSVAFDIAKDEYLDDLRADSGDVTEKWRRRKYPDKAGETDLAEQRRAAYEASADPATERFIELLDGHGSEPRIRARLIEVLESRADDNPVCEVIELVKGEEYIFTDDRGIPALSIKHIKADLVIEAMDADGKLINGFVMAYPARVERKDKTDRMRLTRIGNLIADLIEDESLPKKFRGNLHDAVIETMNDLGKDANAEAGRWMRGRFADACMRVKGGESR